MHSPRPAHRTGRIVFRRRVIRALSSSLIALALSGATAASVAQPGVSAELSDPTASPGNPSSARAGFALESAPGLSLGLGAYGGLALLMTRGENHPHALAGVLSRARYSYFELGAVIEISDYVQDEWRSIGAFAGAWLPYRNWVDFELAAGLAARRYSSTDPRYGAGGYELSTPALMLRLGLSDRSSDGLFGARLGGEIVAAFDLRQREARWRYQTSDPARPLRGTTPVGGFSLGVALSVGFDVALKARRTTARADGSLKSDTF